MNCALLGLLRSELWQFLTDVSGPIDPLTLEDGMPRLSRKVSEEFPLLAAY